MKNSADLGGCYPARPSASVDNTLLDLQNSSYPTQPHSIIAKYTMMAKPMKTLQLHCISNDPVFNNLGHSPVLAGEYSVT